jgi:hypothetical protein
MRFDTVIAVFRGGIVRVRSTLVAASACDTGRALQMDYEVGGRETMISASLKFRAALFDLLAAMLGHRS